MRLGNKSVIGTAFDALHSDMVEFPADTKPKLMKKGKKKEKANKQGIETDTSKKKTVKDVTLTNEEVIGSCESSLSPTLSDMCVHFRNEI
ncbi:hypothetical protein RFI_04448 [Reticulomyxa filosa]|uniref:Uncharacterized protein n=1 Tax=Reticulomyxa filosa TaxID=46433 RepID=X6P369_RETFI|nr:hypothetical protein RFI_04448 [Reticulomyxa filosa]|eukprot:ETO32666.1 hypothetical protein RFI_04448 [Reticulomyxa filosa]